MNSLISFLFLTVLLSSFLNGCYSSRFSYLLFPQSNERPVRLRNLEGRRSETPSFQLLDEDHLQSLNGEFETEKRKPSREFSRKEAPSREFSSKAAPSCALNKVYCKTDDEYDDDVKIHFKRALSKTNMNDQVFGIMSKILVDPPGPTATRHQHDFFEDPVCPSRQLRMYPKRGQTKSEEWRFILNQDEFKQAIKYEECANFTGLRSRSKNGELMCSVQSEEGSKSVCTQKFIYRNMLTLNKYGNNVTVEAILIPSCCSCVRRKENYKASVDTNRINMDADYRRYASKHLKNIWD